MALFQDLDTLNGKCSVNYSLSCYFIKQPFIIQQWNFIHVFSIKTYGNSWSSITLTCILTTLCSFVKYTLFLLHNDNIQILVLWGKRYCDLMWLNQHVIAGQIFIRLGHMRYSYFRQSGQNGRSHEAWENGTGKTGL